MQTKQGVHRRGHLYALSLVTLIGLFFVNTMGFIDTETGSAMGCGDNWPLCNGTVIPAKWGLHTLIEFTHRFIVLISMVLLVLFAVLAWRRYGRHRIVRILIGFAALGVFLESILGALAVFFVNPPAVLATHMGIALVSFGSVFVLTALIRQVERGSDQAFNLPAPGKDFRRLAWFTLAYTFVAIYWGAYVASTGDGDSFRGWPFPTESYSLVHGVLIVDILHRSIALGLVLLNVWLTVKARRQRTTRPDLYRASVSGLVLVLLQAFSGAYLIYSHLSLPAFLVHVSIVTFLFGTLCYSAARSQEFTHSSRRQPISKTTIQPAS